MVVAKRKERLEEIVAEAETFSGKIHPYPGDVQKKVCNGMIDYAVDTCGQLDVLVNNAGTMDEFIPIGEMSNELYEKVMSVNLNGIYLCNEKINLFLYILYFAIC